MKFHKTIMWGQLPSAVQPGDAQHCRLFDCVHPKGPY